MPTYVFVCPNGHEHELFCLSHASRPVAVGCPKPRCRQLARPSIAATMRAGVQINDDIPEHFNLSLNMGIRSRAHLREVQQARGCQDVEGAKHFADPPSDWR